MADQPVIAATAHHHELIFPIVQNRPSKYVNGDVIGVVSSSSPDLEEASVTGADTLLRFETSAGERVAEFLGERIVA